MNLTGVERNPLGPSADAFQPADDDTLVHGRILVALLHQPPPGGFGSEYPSIDISGGSRRLRGLVPGLVDRNEAFGRRHPTPHIVILSFRHRLRPPVGQSDAGQQPRARNERQAEFCLHPFDGRVDIDLLVAIGRACRAELFRPHEQVQIRRPEQRPLADGRRPQPISRPPAVGQPRFLVDLGIAPHLDDRLAESGPRESGVSVAVGRRGGQDGCLALAEHRLRPAVDSKGEIGGQLLELHAPVRVAPRMGVCSTPHAPHELEHRAARPLCGAGIGILPSGCRDHHPDPLQ